MWYESGWSELVEPLTFVVAPGAVNMWRSLLGATYLRPER